MPLYFVLALALLAVARATTFAEDVFFVITHGNMLSTRLDPIMNPGAVSSHVHAIIGSNAFNPVYSYDNSRSANCTTANVLNDFSSYWMPQLYHVTSDGYKLAPLTAANTYYQMRRQPDEPVYEFPANFRMLAGDPSRTTFNASDPSNAAISYVCLGSSIAQGNQFPAGQCPDGLRAQVYFQHCWDGVNDWLEGSAHVSYATTPDGGEKCPDSHPKRIMGLFYEFIFDDTDYTGTRAWSFGDTVGNGLHADFTMGWPQGFFSEVFSYGKTCSVEFDIGSCPPLQAQMDTNNTGGSQCGYHGTIVDEDIGLNGVISKLPGNNAQYGAGQSKPSDPNYKETAQFISSAPPIPGSWEKLGCVAEATGSRLLSGAQTTGTDMTPQSCMAFCADKQFPVAGVEFGTQCFCASTLPQSAILNDGKCATPCALLDSFSRGYCGGSSTLTIYQYTGSGSPSVQNATNSDFPPSPSTITSVPAETIILGSVSGDTGYAATTIITAGGGGSPASVTADAGANPTATATATSLSNSSSATPASAPASPTTSVSDTPDDDGTSPPAASLPTTTNNLLAGDNSSDSAASASASSSSSSASGDTAGPTSPAAVGASSPTSTGSTSCKRRKRALQSSDQRGTP